MPEQWWEHYETEHNIEQERIARIAIQNDLLRKTLCVGGRIEMDKGVTDLSETKASVLRFMLQEYEKFHPEQRTGKERKEGVINLFHKKFVWEINYYDRFSWDKGLKIKSANPECVFSTFRILSIKELELDQKLSPNSLAS